MNDVKYIGMDVHKETISIAVMDEGRTCYQDLVTRSPGIPSPRQFLINRIIGTWLTSARAGRI